MASRQTVNLRYAIVTICFLLFSIALIIKLFHTTVMEASQWNQRAEKELSQTTPIAPERGNILASNGNILACNLKVYDIKADLRHNKVMSLKNINMNKIDSLADSLDYYYPLKLNLYQHPDTFAKYTWHKRLKDEFEKNPGKRRRSFLIARKKNLEDFEKIRNFPFFNDFEG